jgi:hypothetical protein
VHRMIMQTTQKKRIDKSKQKKIEIGIANIKHVKTSKPKTHFSPQYKLQKEEEKYV